MNENVTYLDIAKILNISPSTVSRALNDKPGVSKKLRKKILDTIEELNYIPNETARSLSTNTSRTVAAIVPDILNPYYSEMIKYLEKTFRKNNFSFLICITNENDESMNYYLNDLLKKRVAGIILLSSVINDEKLFQKVKANTNLIGINSWRDDMDKIICTEKLGTYTAIKHLIELGHKNIAFIGYLFDYNETLKDRLDGYKEALFESGIEYDPNLVIECDSIKQAGACEIEKILALEPRPTAIHCMNEYIALGCYSAIREKGMSIPENFSFSAQDGLKISNVIYPKLTTIVSPIEAMAKASSSLLLKRIKEGRVEFTETIKFSYSFRKAQSTIMLK